MRLDPLWIAMQAAERSISSGLEPCFAVELAARRHDVDAVKLTVLMFRKVVGVLRAREAVASLKDGDRAAEQRRKAA